MIFLLDTTTFSDLMRGSPLAETYLSHVSPIDRVLVCAIVRGEIRYGIERLMPGKRRRELEAKAARLFDAIACEPVPEAAADQYARIKTAACAKGLPLDEVDGLLLADWNR